MTYVSKIWKWRAPHVAWGIAFSLLAVSCENFTLEEPNRFGVAEAGVYRKPVSDRGIVALVNTHDSALLLEEKARRRGFRLLRKEVLGGLDYVMLEFEAPLGLDPAVAGEELEKLEPHATADGIDYYGFSSAGAPAGTTAGEPAAPAPPLERQRPDAAQTPGDEPASDNDVKGADDVIGARDESPASSAGHSGDHHQCSMRYRIGLIDSDVAVNAPGLRRVRIMKQHFISNTVSSPADTPDNTPDNTPDDTHGTAVAELLVRDRALHEGMLYSAVVLDERGEGLSSVTSLIRALDWMAQSGVDIVNISLAGPYNKSLDRAIQRFARRGLVVAAVGNDGPDAPPRYPAAFDDVIAVTAVDMNGAIFDRASRGPHVDFSALGVDLYVAGRGAGRFVSGTSFAAPLVTSVLASAWANPEPALAQGNGPDTDGFFTLQGARAPDAIAYRAMSASDVRKRLADRVQDLGPKGRDAIYGFGLLPYDVDRCSNV